jgi:hypothetical protein
MAQHTTHRHRVSHEDGPKPMSGMCPCPGCRNAGSYYIEHCTCGATRTVCSGMGAASLPTHRAHGFSRWGSEEEV